MSVNKCGGLRNARGAARDSFGCKTASSVWGLIGDIVRSIRA